VKPNELRARRKREQEAAKVRGEKLEAFLRSGEPKDLPAPHLAPDDSDRVAVLREYRRLVRLAAGEMRGTAKHASLLDRAVVQLARLVFIERVLAVERSDPVARLALTASDLVRLSVVDPEEIRARLNALQGESRVEVAR
jgi:hypothetical protein